LNTLSLHDALPISKERIPISVENKITGGNTDSINIPVDTNII
jgi:hypothetical protein